MDFGSLSDSGFGSVSLFGLDEFGQVTGMNPLWGAVAGAGFQTVGAIAARQFVDSFAMDKWSEAIGAGVGVAAGGVMMAFGNTRAAGVTAIATSLVNGGLRQIEALMFGATYADKLAAMNKKIASLKGEDCTKAGGAGEPCQIAPYLVADKSGYNPYVLGEHVVESANPRMVGLGMVQAEQTHGFAGPNVQVMGPPIADYGVAGPAAAQVQLMGGPTLSGLGSHFGATLFSNG